VFGCHEQPQQTMSIEIEQITGGETHHFFGYIGQSLTTPWNGDGTRLLTLRADFHDHLPDANEPADVALIHLDKKQGNYYEVEKVDESLGWNFQQGTMFYWNPDNPTDQFFFNDRDPATGKVFTVLFDIKQRKRIKEYRFDDTPVGNGGVSPAGKSFLAINYARMARLRPVTGYKGAADWTEGVAAPKDDGIFLIDIATGKKTLLVSFERLAQELKNADYAGHALPLFINHTLWNRDGNLVYFFVRAGWKSGSDRSKRVNVACTIRTDGTDLFVGHPHIGGHPEWGIGSQIIGRQGDDQVIYDVHKREIVGTIATPEALPNPEGDISLSPDGNWFVNGHGEQDRNFYTVVRLSDGHWVRSEGLYKGSYIRGDLRIDPAPRWNRSNDQILVPGLTENGSRQLFMLTVK
jgi:hypothetical protein